MTINQGGGSGTVTNSSYVALAADIEIAMSRTILGISAIAIDDNLHDCVLSIQSPFES